jgi:hypothetical protein
MQINPLNIAALTYWSNTKYSEADLLAVCREYNDECLFAKIDFKPNQPLTITVSSAVDRTRQGHYTSYFRFYDAISKMNSGSQLEGSFIAFFEDGLYTKYQDLARRVPIFSVGKSIHDHYSFIIPDATFIDNNAHQQSKITIDQKEASIDWKNKKNILFWRGAASGLETVTSEWENALRIRLCKKVKELNTPLCDIGISRIAPCGNIAYEKGVLELEILKPEVPFSEFLNYKYQLDIDGVCCAWLSFFLKLYSNTVTFKVASEFQQWYYHLLKPWHHYIPLSTDFSEIEEVINWAINHDKECQEIAENSTKIIKSLNLTDALNETKALLDLLFTAQKKT